MELDEAVESFWDRFLQERGDFVSFALSEADRFEPNTFIPDFLARIHRAGWCRKDDRGFAVARLIMDRLRLAVARNLDDGDEFVCSIYDLEKKIKKRIEKERKKKQTPPWDLSSVENAISHFWDEFFMERCDRTVDLRAFALSRTLNFPESFMVLFHKSLDRAGWSSREDPTYKIPYTMMSRLGVRVAISDFQISALTPLESEIEKAKEIEEQEIRNAQKKEEDDIRKADLLLKREEKFEAHRRKTEKEKAAREARNKAAKEIREIARKKNLENRIGVQSSGLDRL